ncbi:phage holin family protein [uncultured Deinococcus sp.]|uniref:phage holin family protein n=1 Tax=uncultured Deinococcus sp. TaxID=158789 RepID=UPI0025D97B83|nr:phage holin family protein [uncultured Deinococcus sp.]
MEERKSMGSALVDVFDAGVTLVKSEINAVARKAGDIAKAKGIGVVLLLASVGPLVMALIFLILAVFYGLMRLGAGPWFAALLIALFSFLVTGGLIFVGLRRLGAEVKTDEPLIRRHAMSDDHSDDSTPRPGTTTDRTTDPGKAPATAAGRGWRIDQDAPVPTAAGSRPGDSVEVPRDPQRHAAGENRVVQERPGQATVRVEKGTSTVPVYESQPDGTPEMYGSGLNEKLEGKEHDSPSQGTPAAPRKVPGIPVSTDPTFQDDMRRGKDS